MGVGGFLVGLVSGDFCTTSFSGVVFDSNNGDFTGLLGVCFSFSPFSVTCLLSFTMGGGFCSLSTTASSSVGDALPSGVLTALATRGAFIAVVTNGEGVDTCVCVDTIDAVTG